MPTVCRRETRIQGISCFRRGEAADLQLPGVFQVMLNMLAGHFLERQLARPVWQLEEGRPPSVLVLDVQDREAAFQQAARGRTRASQYFGEPVLDTTCPGTLH